MSYSQETFESYFSKMNSFQTIADKNNLALKELLMKKAGADEELADALIEAWESKTGGSAGSTVSPEALAAYMRDMGAFQKLADLQGIPLQEWLIAMCGIDPATAGALIREWEPRAPQQSASLLDFAREPEVIPEDEKPANKDTAKDPRRKRADEDAENDMVITISRGADEPGAQRMPAVEIPGLESQIDMLHSLADSLGHQEPFHAIGELKSFELKKNYLTNTVTYEMKSRAERLISLREDQNKKLLRHEKNLIETRQELAALQENQPKLFGREAHNRKIQAVEEAVKKTEHEITSLHKKKAEQERAYREALALIEKHTEEKLLIDRQYKIDEEKFNQAKEVIISALHWSLLDIPDDILAGSVLGNLEWYTSFFKALPEKIDLPLQGWLKAYPIAHTLTYDYPAWHEEIETIHFVIENDIKGLKDLVRHFLDAFVAHLKELFLPVGQLCMLQKEAKKTEGATMQDMADKMEHDLLASFDQSVIEFSIARLGSFYIIQALSELLNFEAQVKAFFENLEHAEHFPLQNKARSDAYRQKFTRLAEACAKVLKVSFEAAGEVLAPAEPGSQPDDTALCRKSIQADFENYFKSAEKKLTSLLQ